MKTVIALVLFSVTLVACTDPYDEVRYDYRDRVTGRYDMDEYSETYGDYVYYSFYVSKEYGSHDGIYLDDFYTEGTRVYAYFNDNRVTIPFQISSGYEIEGHGTYYGGELHLSYRVRDRYSNGLSDYCESIAYRD